MTQFEWQSGNWTTAPAGIEYPGPEMAVTAIAGSDAWRHTSYGFVHDTEHALLRPLAIGRAVEVTFVPEFTEQFDQAGAFLRFGPEHWIKAGLEYADGVLNLGAVVTAGRSDWSVAPVDEWMGCPVTIRISRAFESVTIRAKVEGGSYRLVRLAPTPPDADVEAGPMVCAPTRAGLVVRFTDWRESEADASLH